MKQQRYLTIIFDTIIRPHEIPAFRGAVARKVGFDKDLFHNHRADGSFYYRYPLIQYKQFGRHPGIVCLEHSIDEVYHLFSKKTNTISVSGRELELQVKDLSLKTVDLKVTDVPIEYNLQSWVALNQKNHPTFTRLETVEEKIQMLEGILAGNILSFAKGIDWWIEKRFDLEIIEVMSEKWIRNKNTKVIAFDLKFNANIILPPFIGLGKGASRGKGIVNTIYQSQMNLINH